MWDFSLILKICIYFSYIIYSICRQCGDVKKHLESLLTAQPIGRKGHPQSYHPPNILAFTVA